MVTSIFRPAYARRLQVANNPRELPKRREQKGKNCMAVDAVASELLSGPNSLLTGKNTGNFSLMTNASGYKWQLYRGLAEKSSLLRQIGTGNYNSLIWDSLFFPL
jgi:hypothetical protein